MNIIGKTKRAQQADAVEAAKLLLENFGLEKGRRIWTIAVRENDASSVIACYVVEGERILQLPPRRIAALLTSYTVTDLGTAIGNRVRAMGTSRAYEIVEGLGMALHGDGHAFVMDRL